jgi:hypothetical protein
MRYAQQLPSRPAAERADAAVEALSADQAAEPSAVRTAWFDAYVEAGGAFVQVCTRRFATFDPDMVVAQLADRIFAERHPERNGAALGFGPEDQALRSEWMDLYVEFGGTVGSICDPATC